VLQRDSEGESKRTQFVQQHVSRLEEGSYVNSVYDASVLTTTCILSSCDEKRVEVAWNNAFWKFFSAHRHESLKTISVLLLLSSCIHLVTHEETVILEENDVQWKFDSV